MNEITLGDKIYISSKRAAEITGYAKDYVGQLCREGHVDAKMVGRSWYVYEPSIRAHRFGEDADAQVGESDQGNATEMTENEADAAIEGPAAATSSWERPTYTPEEPQKLPEITVQETFTASYTEPLPPAEETLTDMQAAWREWFERKQQEAEVPVMEEGEEEKEDEAEEAEEDNEEDDTEDETNEEETVDIPLHRIQPAAPEPVYAPAPEVQKIVDMQRVAPQMTPKITLHTAPQTVSAAPQVPQSTPQAPTPAAYTAEYAAPQASEGRIVHERIITRTPSSPARKSPQGRTSVKQRTKSHAPAIALLVGISIIAIAVGYIGSGFADKYISVYASDNPVINFLVGTREFNR